MRRIATLVPIVLLAATPGWAGTIEPGVIELSGAASVSGSWKTTDFDEGDAADVDSTAVTVDVAGNYFFLPDLGAGVFLSWEDVGGDGPDSSVVAIGPQVEWHYPLDDALNLFVAGAVGFASLESDSTDADGWLWKVGGGLKYFLGRAVSADVSLAYGQEYWEGSGSVDFDIGGFDAGVGFSVYLE